ncbi:MAG TPA: hypothetical protein VNY55_05585, partial [Mycobacterium sp.]|nr:hypothetical protein [Mycobacterium sp.]
ETRHDHRSNSIDLLTNLGICLLWVTSGREVGARLSPGAHLVTRDDRFHDALNAVNAAVMLGVGAEMALRRDVITNTRMPEPIPVFPAQQAM